MSTIAFASFKLEIPHNGNTKEKLRSSSDLYHVASVFYHLSEEVDKEWSTLPEEKKNLYKSVVYRALDAEQNFFQRVKYQWRILGANEDALFQYKAATWRFVNVVLDKVEEDNKQFKSDIIGAINEVNTSDDVFSTEDNALEQLRQLSS